MKLLRLFLGLSTATGLGACTATEQTSELAAPRVAPTVVNTDADRRAIYNSNGGYGASGGAVPDATLGRVRLGEQAADINSRQRVETLGTNSANTTTPETRIRRESFVATADTAEVAAAQPNGHGDVSAAASDEVKSTRTVTIQYEGSEYLIEVPKGKTILEVALDQDIDLPYSCQAGLCTACRGKCLTGQVHLDEREGLSDSEMKQGYILTCVGHPMTDDVVIEIG